MLTNANALLLACAKPSIGSMQVGFLMTLAGVSVREFFDNVRYWWRPRVPRARQQAESVKRVIPENTQILFRVDVIEIDPPNHLSD